MFALVHEAPHSTYLHSIRLNMQNFICDSNLYLSVCTGLCDLLGSTPAYPVSPHKYSKGEEKIKVPIKIFVATATTFQGITTRDHNITPQTIQMLQGSVAPY